MVNDLRLILITLISSFNAIPIHAAFVPFSGEAVTSFPIQELTRFSKNPELFLNENQPFQLAEVRRNSPFIPPPSEEVLKQRLERLQQVLKTKIQAKDRKKEADTLNQIGDTYTDLENYDEAREYHQKAVNLYQELSDYEGKIESIGYIGNTYFQEEEYYQLQEFIKQQLDNYKNQEDQAGEKLFIQVLNEFLEKRWKFNAALGYGQAIKVFQKMSKHQMAWHEVLELSEFNLWLSQIVKNRQVEADSLHGLGWIYRNLGQYPQSLNAYQESLKINQGLKRAYASFLLAEIGIIYVDLAQYDKALEFLQQALNAPLVKLGYFPGYPDSYWWLPNPTISEYYTHWFPQDIALNQIGLIYQKLDQPQKALYFFRQSLLIDSQGDLFNTYRYIGSVYFEMGEYAKALEYYQKLEKPTSGDPAAAGFLLSNQGLVYEAMGNPTEALDAYRKALTLFRNLNVRPGEREALSQIGLFFEKQNQSELAIIFYKQSVNVTEVIRQDLRVLPRELQQSYTETVADTYRHLADLLLKQDRVLEAQQVLDLLKVQELNDYLRNVRGNSQTVQGVAHTSQERQIKAGYEAILDQAIVSGKELAALEKIPVEQRTTEQQQQIIALRKNEQEITQQFQSFLQSPEVTALTAQLRQATGGENFDLSNARSLQDNLKRLQQNAVILYPFILEDRIELVLVTPYSPPIRRTVPVKRTELNQAIVEFRSALEDPYSDAKISAGKLYQWLIQPIENDLVKAQAETIIYAPDGQLRYIPLAALYDGKQWLIEQFQINNITALSLTDFETKPPKTLQVFAGAFTQGSYDLKVGEEQFNFSGLPFAGIEVENLANTIPQTTKLLNEQFNRDSVLLMNDYSVVHLATHAAFVAGQPEDSLIMFGNGDHATLRDVETWSLSNVDLVVLSACETGLGGKLGNGEEILGFGYLMQRAGAKAAIASLWSVDDGGTQALMNAFYAVLQSDAGQSSITKAEALRQAQIALISNNYTALGQQRGLAVQQRNTESLPTSVTQHLSHPFYWAPFILIGNGL